MSNGRIRVLSAVPGSTSLGPILRDFLRHSEGTVTAFNDAVLPLCRRFVDEDHPVEVLPFGELVHRILTLCGETAFPIAQSGHYEAAIARACRDLDDDTPFSGVVRHPGLHRALVRTLGELHHWGIDADEMSCLSQGANPRLAAKLSALAQLDRDSQAILLQLGRQISSAHLQSSLDCTPERDGSLERVLVIAGSEESPLRVRWLKWAASVGMDVTVVIDRHATDAPLFAGATRTAALLGVEPIQVGEGNRLTRNLFSSAEHGGAPVEVSIVSAADPLAEAEWALRSCLEEDRPDQSAIYVRDLETYAPLIEAAAKRFHIPIRLSRRAPLLTNSFARLTLDALDFCASDDVRKLSPMLHSSYLGLTGEAQSRLLSGLRNSHSTRTQQWEELERWAVANGEEFPWVETLLSWRRKAISGNAPLRDWMLLLGELVGADERFPWSTKIATGDPKMSDRDRRARNQLQRLLANHISVEAILDARTYSLREVVDLCRRIWSAADVSIPSQDFGVCVTDQVEALVDSERLLVLGMLEGVFPRRRSEEPILTDAERREISSLRPGEPSLPDSHTRANTERDTFYRVAATARSRLICSYPLADDQRDNIPAFYLTEVERAAGTAHKHDFPRLQYAPPAEECRLDADRLLRAALDGPRDIPEPVTISTETARAHVRPREGQKFRPAELRDALECPFSYVVRHRLGLKVRRPSARWQSLRKLPQVTHLVAQPNREQAFAALMSGLEAELDTLYSDVPEWELQLLRSGGQRLIEGWLRREFRARQTWPKEPDSIRLNVPFGEDGLRSSMPGGIELEGTVPALSRMKRYSVAHLNGIGVKDAAHLTDSERLMTGIYFLALYSQGIEGALEVESMSGTREMIVLSREGGTLFGYKQDGLSVVDVSGADADPKAEFFKKVKNVLKKAAAIVHSGTVDPIRGDQCERCHYGELCRRSMAFGEEDSPFGRDVVLDER